MSGCGYGQPNRLPQSVDWFVTRKPTFAPTIMNDRVGSGLAIGSSIQHGEIVHCSELTSVGQVRSFGAAAQKARLRINKQSFVQCVTYRRF